MTYNYKKYEFTAFTEADFLGQGGNGSSIGCGDTFTMPGAATVTLSTWDNDSTLSGDSHDRATDWSGQDAIVDGARVGCQMYAESYHVLCGSDGKTYYMLEIEVEGYDAPGAGDDFFTFYGAVPPAGVSLTVVNTCNVSGCWVDYRCLGAGTDAPANQAPTFTNLPENGIICVDENQTIVIDIAAHDADGDALTYEIVGGADAGAFEIDPATGELTFVAAADYEAPTDGDGNNVYDVTVKVSDGQGGEEIKPLWIKVKDVAETGWIKGRFTNDADGNDNEWNDETCSWDTGIAGATIELVDLSGNVIATTTTDSHGNYMFDVPAGDYRVKFPSVDGTEFSAQNSGVAEHFDSDADASGLTDVISLSAGGVICDVDTGVKTVVTTVSTCMVVEAEDMELCGYRVENNANASEGQLIKGSVCGWSSAKTVFDGEDGQYDLKLSVLDECDGQGRIVVTVNGCWVLDTRLNQDNGGNGVHNSTFNVLEINDIDLKAGDCIQIWGYGQGGEYVRIDKLEICGEAQDPMTAELGDTVFFDADNDGIRDAGELGAANVTVILKDAQGNIVDQTETNSDGSYLFTGLAAGDYTVSVVAPGAYGFSGAVDAATGVSNLVTLAAGESNQDVDAGLVDPATGVISGRVFSDDNANDLNDETTPVDNVLVTLLNADGTPTGLTTTTQADGSYSFTGLTAGDYKVSFAPMAPEDNRIFAGKNAGLDDAIDSDANADGTTDVITLGVAGTAADVDAGLQDPATASITGRVFSDDNANDLNDETTPVDNVLVTLLNADGTPTGLTTTTQADGSYSFTGLTAGDYKVSFAPMAPEDAHTFVGQDAGTDDTIDSDVDAAGVTETFTLAIAQTKTDLDAGIEAPNADPIAVNDTLRTPADTPASVDLLDNDNDPDSNFLEVLFIEDADEMAFVGETLTLESGALATLNADGTVSYDANGVHDDLLVCVAYAEETISYTVADAQGGWDVADLDITVCGTASSLEMICDSLPAQVQLNIGFDGVDYQIVVADDAATSADDGLASGIWTGACIDIVGELILDTDLLVNVYGPCETLPDGLIQNPENLDLISWILNEQFLGQTSMDGTGQYGVFDIQEAVWALSDGTATNNALANEIVAKAQADGEGFMAGEGDLVAVVFDPIAPDASVTDTQTFIMGVEWDALALDCIC